jgi:hypothetical protein
MVTFSFHSLFLCVVIDVTTGANVEISYINSHTKKHDERMENMLSPEEKKKKNEQKREKNN